MERTLYVLPIGVINIPTGKTQYDWSVYESDETSLYLCSGSFLLYGAKGTLKVGDELTLRNNDTQRKLKTTNVTAILTTESSTIIKELFELGYDYRQLRAFKKKAFKRKLMTSYSIK